MDGREYRRVWDMQSSTDKSLKGHYIHIIKGENIALQDKQSCSYTYMYLFILEIIQLSVG